jgi:hypothetical protein
LNYKEVGLDSRFAALVDQLAPKTLALSSGHIEGISSLPRDPPLPGVYLFSDGKKHLYVGRSKNIRARYFMHSRAGSPHNQASFAFLLAAEATNTPPTKYAKGEGRAFIVQRSPFKEAFLEAKARIRSMTFRWVVESDPVRQALLEIYAAVTLGAKYNDFKTH